MVGHADVELVERVVVYDCNNFVRGDGVDERFGLHVQCHCDECQWDWCGFGGVGCCDTVDGAGCADFGVGNLECERFVGCVVDCAGVDRWCCDHGLHGDVDTGFFHLHHRDNLVHGDGDECQWDRLGLVGLGCCGSFHGAGCSDRGERDWCCERIVGCVVGCTGQ